MWKTNWTIGADCLAFRHNLIEYSGGQSYNFNQNYAPKQMSFILFSKQFRFDFNDDFLQNIIKKSDDFPKQYRHSFYQTCYFKV